VEFVRREWSPMSSVGALRQDQVSARSFGRDSNPGPAGSVPFKARQPQILGLSTGFIRSVYTTRAPLILEKEVNI